MGKKPRNHRVPMMMSEEELSAIDDWRYSNRIATRSDAIRRLCKMALIDEELAPQQTKEMEALTGALMPLIEIIEADPFAGVDDDTRSKLIEHATEAGSALLSVFDTSVLRTARVMPLRDNNEIEEGLRLASRMRDFLKNRSVLKVVSESNELRERLLGEVARKRRETEAGEPQDE